MATSALWPLGDEMGEERPSDTILDAFLLSQGSKVGVCMLQILSPLCVF